MHSYEELVELARTCARQARIAQTDDLRTVLKRMAQDYQRRAAELRGGELPSIDD